MTVVSSSKLGFHFSFVISDKFFNYSVLDKVIDG